MRTLPSSALLALVRFVLARARLKHLARRMLQTVPAVHARLQLMLHRAALPPRSRAPEPTQLQLSPRALALHRQLMRLRTR